jgi:hypothetical protein
MRAVIPHQEAVSFDQAAYDGLFQLEAAVIAADPYPHFSFYHHRLISFSL